MQKDFDKRFVRFVEKINEDEMLCILDQKNILEEIKEKAPNEDRTSPGSLS